MYGFYFEISSKLSLNRWRQTESHTQLKYNHRKKNSGHSRVSEHVIGKNICEAEVGVGSHKVFQCLPGTPRADVECHFGLWLRLIRAPSLAEFTAGRSQSCHTLHPQVIQVLCRGGGGSKNEGKRRPKGMGNENKEEKTQPLITLVSRWHDDDEVVRILPGAGRRSNQITSINHMIYIT